jgi:two-component system nitrate/nitrite response regulator NarL
MSETPIRVLILADDPLARAGVASLLEEREEVVVAGSMATANLGEDSLDVFRPDVILWDLGWDSGSGEAQGGSPEFNWAEAIREDGPPLVALLSDDSQALYAWTMGAKAVLDRGAAGSELVLATRAVSRGLTVIAEKYQVHLLPTIEGIQGFPLEPLTGRELEVLQLLAEGLSNKALAGQLEVSESTVKFHINAIFRKLGVQSRTQAVIRASRLGLILL